MVKNFYKEIQIGSLKLPQLIPLFLLVITIGFSGCAGISPSKTKAFQSNLSDLDVGIQAQLQLISTQIIDGQAERVLFKEKPALLDTDFPPVLSPGTKASLLNQISVMREYANLLREITDRSYSGKFKDAVAKLNAQIGKSMKTVNGLKEGQLADDATIAQINKQLGLLSGVAASIGELVINAYAQHKTKDIIKNYDPKIREYCRSLQIIIDPDPDHDSKETKVGLIALTTLAYRQSRNAFAARFEANKRPSKSDANYADKIKSFEQEQRRLLTLYRENLEGERLSILALGSLRETIGKIADAHAALARDSDIDFWTAVNQASDYLELVTLALKLKETEKAK